MRIRRNSIRPGITSKDSKLSKPSSDLSSATRRSFLGRLGGAAAATLAAGTVELVLPRTAAAHEGSRDPDRENDSFQIRVRAASEEREVRIPANQTNGDEDRYSNFIGDFSKGLPHNALGE